MTSINPIQYLTKQGLTISITDNKLNVKPSNRVTKEIANYIKQHKDTIKNQLLAHSQNVGKLLQLTELSPIQYNWLNQIANILQVTPDYLLQHKLIDQFDLVELIDKPPVIVANTIKAGYYWLKLN
ncbi:hypothetical protein [Entomomonas asaccharolytica]|uniref:TubC N-terminal docking domain-containing protein n=1 Tax=Entomomonas asaccharolytica TaxID=2785331 RepID=A0A974NET9_9GAMM|nr:hypothetical protein [Entomomonas asaccharolytica]QQP85466.1 hypothetical protein JHT90_14000 [Entomomonas asaccharolytica]